MQVTWDFRFLFQNQCSYLRSCIFSHCIQGNSDTLPRFFSIYFFFHSVFMHIKRSNYVWKRLLWNLHLHSNVAYKMTESMLCIRWEIIMISMSFLMRTELTARIHLHGHIWVVIWCHTIQSNYKNIHKIIPMPYWNAVRNAIISAKTVDFAHTHTAAYVQNCT